MKRRHKGGIRNEENEVYEDTEGLELSKTYKVFETAYEACEDYQKRLMEFENIISKIESKNEFLNTIIENIDELYEYIDDIMYELSKKNTIIKDREIARDSCIEVLETLGYKDIENEVEKCYEIIRLYPEQISSSKENIIRLDEKLKNNNEKVLEKQELINKENEILNIFEEIFKEEYELSYVEFSHSFKSILETCNAIKKKNNDNSNKSKEAYDSELFDSYNKNSGILRDYQPKVVTIFKKNIENDEHRQLYQNSERKDIKFRVNGKEVPFNILKEIISKEKEENKILLSDKEKEFFQDILIKTISNKIRAKIYHSKSWVTKMNDLMESMNTSSGFKLTLKWISKKAENETQMDTKKLIEILSKDSDLIRQEDIENLSKHFSSKIKEILRDFEDTGERKNYYTIIRDILDYRKWYEFKLYSKKENENIKELTNNAFFQLSGGEKAMSMYVPLFAAINSMYDMADKKDCPRVVSLDEAFAGVDEDNIRDMFRILREMNLDYILNSQILWGDYDTVDNLSIAEIVRPENSDTVSVLRYHWNGKEKQYIS